jgi:hypothetical protein
METAICQDTANLLNWEYTVTDLYRETMAIHEQLTAMLDERPAHWLGLPRYAMRLRKLTRCLCD